MFTAVRRLIAVSALSGGLAGAASGEQALDYSVDSIFDLDRVRDITFTGEDGMLLVTMADRVLRFGTFPLEVNAEIGVKIDAISGVVTKEDTLVVLGDDPKGAYPREGLKRGIERYTTGVILTYPNISKSLNAQIDPFIIPLTTTPFSESLLTDDGVLFATNPTWSSVVRTDVTDMVSYLTGTSDTPFYLDDLFLQCGTASSFSVFENKDQVYYTASVTGAKLIEYGPIEYNNSELPQSDCFDPNGSPLSKTVSTQALNQNALQHTLIDNTDAIDDPLLVSKMLLTFDADTAKLQAFPIREFRGKLSMSRSTRFGYDMQQSAPGLAARNGRFGLLAADTSGDIILVSFLGANAVYRFRQTEGEIDYAGMFEFSKPVRMLRVSEDGNFVAIALGDTRRDVSEELLVIHNPRAIPDRGPLTRVRHSVLHMQELLLDSGFELTKDGIYGPQTDKAIKAYLEATQVPAPSQPASIDLNGALGAVSPIFTAPTAARPLKPNTEIQQIGNSLRGLFPLQKN
ncbi:hypothetical protein E4Z66_17260 [Aliishimia ponticola]|uniref:Peptidoglycan binding-like domain-containing protein n=1 Tax=Aliishimia ponticola TaxID=2499833 RepID=A0A4S4N9F9_9RHOB|nr:hypothetical protein [Aliishimia ponticola]THH34718.1 hypothetical protein E4Z66_17260 [Aliishimia ponticola]